jgi:uncharacterized membrane protein
MSSEKSLIKEKKFPVRIILFILLFIWSLGFSTVLFYSPLAFLYPVFNHSCSLVCHQDAARTLSLTGINMLVCSRCAGIYSGALILSFLSLMIFNFKTPHLKYLALAVVPLLLDVIFINIGLYSYNKGISFSTGFILGSVLFIYILEALENFIYYNERQ